MAKVWYCKIGSADGLTNSADSPMRKAVETAFKELTNRDNDFCFSGWGGELTESELAVIEDRMPIKHRELHEIIEQLSMLNWDFDDDVQRQKFQKALRLLIDVNFIEKLKYRG